jgi:rhomboid protease GluP
MVALFTDLSEDEINVCLLILSSARIPFVVSGGPDHWTLSVPPQDEERARDEIDTYYQDNPEIFRNEAEPVIRYSQPVSAGIGVAAGLAVCQWLIIRNGGIALIAGKFGASAEAICRGELYRTVTALMIHSDLVHLSSNLISLAFLFSCVCAVQGFGLASFSVLTTGVLGNYLSALFYQTSHLSIGASTAVFGAVGILIIHQVSNKLRFPKQRYRAWLPLGGGLCLLGLFSQGEHTDTLAHLFGLMSGILVGYLVDHIKKYKFNPHLQFASFTLACVVILLSWMKTE